MTKKMYVGLPTVQLYNELYINSSLRTNYAKWDINSNYTITQYDGYVKIALTGGTTSSGAYPCSLTFSAIEGSTTETRQVIYVQAKVRGKTTNTSWPCIYTRRYVNGSTDPNYIFYTTAIDGASDADLNDGNWHVLSGQSQTYNLDNGNYGSYDRFAFGIRNCTTLNDTMDACDFLVINLTEAFGAGNEPDKTWCDQNINFFLGTRRHVVDTYNPFRDVVATRLYRGYIGVEHTARKIVKGYIGISGIAHKFYDLRGEVRASSNTLSTTKYKIAATTTPDWAVFAGGRYQAGYASAAYSKVVNAVNKYGARTVIDSLTTGRIDAAGGSIDEFVLFAGGTIYNSSSASTITNSVEGYDNNLIKITSTINNLGGARTRLAGTSTKKRTGSNDAVLFAGGCNNAGSTFYSNVYGYKRDLSQITSPTALTEKKADFAVATVDEDTFVFAGGKNTATTPLTSVDAYYQTGTKYDSPAALTNARRNHAAAATKDYILFAGGYLDGGSTPCRITVEVYNYDTIKQDNAASLSERRQNLVGATVDNYIIFAGGDTGNYTTPSKTIDIYQNSIKVSNISIELGVARTYLAAASVDNLFMVAGGYYDNDGTATKTSRIDMYFFE